MPGLYPVANSPLTTQNQANDPPSPQKQVPLPRGFGSSDSPPAPVPSQPDQPATIQPSQGLLPSQLQQQQAQVTPAQHPPQMFGTGNTVAINNNAPADPTNMQSSTGSTGNLGIGVTNEHLPDVIFPHQITQQAAQPRAQSPTVQSVMQQQSQLQDQLNRQVAQVERSLESTCSQPQNLLQQSANLHETNIQPPAQPTATSSAYSSDFSSAPPSSALPSAAQGSAPPSVSVQQSSIAQAQPPASESSYGARSAPDVQKSKPKAKNQIRAGTPPIHIGGSLSNLGGFLGGSKMRQQSPAVSVTKSDTGSNVEPNSATILGGGAAFTTGGIGTLQSNYDIN